MATNIRKVRVVVEGHIASSQAAQADIETDVTTQLGLVLTAFTDAWTEAVAAGLVNSTGSFEHGPSRAGENKSDGVASFASTTQLEASFAP